MPCGVADIASNNGMLPDSTNPTKAANFLQNGPLRTKFSEIWIKIKQFSFYKMQSQSLYAQMAAILFWHQHVKAT